MPNRKEVYDKANIDSNMENKKISNINLKDPFFDTLKEDYPGFNEWFNKKAENGESAFVSYKDNELIDFLYLKEEEGVVLDVFPTLPIARRLKIGTFKIDSRGTVRGERFMKKIMDTALYNNYEEIYVTIFPKHQALIELLERYGFERKAIKKNINGEELVLVKNLNTIKGDILFDYPKITTNGKNKYVLSLYPKYHTKLFPDSILTNEKEYDLINDLSPTNSIHKIYLCFMHDVEKLKRGDILAIYRTNDFKGPAHYRSVVTSICVVEELKTKKDFSDVSDFVKYTNKYSIFDEKELINWYMKDNIYVIKMTYNIAFKRKVTRGEMIERMGINPNIYWGFFQLTDLQFMNLLERGKANENYIID